MDASNQFCDTPNCSNPVEKFVITRIEKIKACSVHTSNLLDKRLTIYDIEAFNFIQSAADLPLYEARRKEAQVGIGNLTVLEAICDRELREALESLEKAKLKTVKVIEAAFELHKINIQRKHQETKDNLQAIRKTLEHFRLEKEAQLSPAEQALLQNMTCQPRFLRSVVTDFSLELAQKAMKSWKCSEQSTEDTLLLLDAETRNKFVTALVVKAKVNWDNGLYDISEEESSYAQSLGSTEELDLRIEKVAILRRKKLAKLLELTVDTEEVRQLASYYQVMALQEFAQGERIMKVNESGADFAKKTALTYSTQRYEKSIKYWEKALRLLKLRLPRDQQTARVSYEYGKFLFEQWDLHSEVSNLLRQSLEIEQALNPYSEETGKTTVLLVRALFNDKKTEQAVDLIRSTLDTFPVHDSTSLFRNVLSCLLAWIFSFTRNKEETEQVLSTCVAAQQDSNHEYSALSLKTLGLTYHNLSRYSEAEEKFKAALTAFQTHFPDSIQIPSTLINLGNLFKAMKRYEEAQTMYQYALVQLRANFPISKLVTVTLTAIGKLCREMKKYRDSEIAYNEVLEIYEARCPQSEEIPQTYHALALVFQDSSSNKRAETYFNLALTRYQRDFISSEAAIEALQDFLKFYSYTKKLKPAEIQRTTTIANLLTAYPTVELTAEIYKYLGDILADSEKYKESEQMWISALQIFEINSPISIKTAKMLCSLGGLYEKMKKNEDAEEAYLKALNIYERYFPGSKDKTFTLFQIVKMYRSMKRDIDAFDIYRTYLPASEETAHFAIVLAEEYTAAKDYKYAELMYRNALTVYTTISPTSTKTINTLTKLGLFYLETQRCTEAEPVLMEALRISKTQFPIPATLPSLLFNLGNLNYTVNQLIAAEGMYREALTISETHFPDFESVSDTCCNLGNICYSLGRLEEAEVEYQKALKLYKAKEPNSPKTAMMLFSLGKVYEALSRTGEAIVSIESAVAIWKVNDVQKVKELAFPSLKTLYTVSERGEKLVELESRASLL